MTTRATYIVGDMLFYAHHDGYPTGAAERFARMIDAWYVPTDSHLMEAAEHPAGGLAFAFIRGNLDVQLANSLKDHGDAEFAYVVGQRESGKIEVTVRSRESKEPDRGELSEWMAHQQRNLRNDLATYWTDHPEDRPNDVNDGRYTIMQQAALDAAEAIPLIVRIERREHAGTEPRIVYATIDQAARIKHRHAVVASRMGELASPDGKKAEQRRMREVFLAMQAAITLAEAVGLTAPKLETAEAN